VNVHSHYENLKVSRDAPPEVIRAAYKALSMLWHPDRSSDPRAPAVMKTINVAYEILSDPMTRAQHDEWLAAEELQWTLNHPTVQRESWQQPRQPAQEAAPREPEPEPSPTKKRGSLFEIDDWLLQQGLKRADDQRLRSVMEHLICLIFKSFRMGHLR
jgi:curved DNA-binding protein CbpA